MNNPAKFSLVHTVVAAVFTVMPIQQSYAAPGTLPSTPLFLSTLVEPNIFLTLDDSFSMNWETMSETSLAGGSIAIDEASPLIDNYWRDYYHPDWHFNRAVVPPVSIYPEAWVLKNSDGNKLYYNPDIDYTPWSGIDATGNPLYLNADPAAARQHPNSGTTTDLTATYTHVETTSAGISVTGTTYLPSYYEWIDDGDGILHATNDKGNLIEIKSANAPFPSGRSYTDELQNFANWFVYYRTRQFTMQSAIGNVIDSTSAARIGLDVFNNGYLVESKSMSMAGNKRALLNRFYGTSSTGGTPARGALKRVGELFSKQDGTGPIVSAAEGGECQQNFNVVLSDGFWNGASPGVGNTDEDTSNIADNGFDGDTNESVDDGYYEDSFSDTLADVAMHYYETDLRPDLQNKVNTISGIDQAEHQHLSTYTIAFGVDGSLDPKTQKPTDAGFAWTDPTALRENKTDDLWHAAYNGRGQFLSANNSAELEASLAIAITDISKRTGTAAAVAINSAKLSTESVVYLAQFDSTRWQGNLFAFPIINKNTGQLAAAAKWDAASVLDAKVAAGVPRTIITYDQSVGVSDGVPFNWASLSAAMQNDLKTNPGGGLDSDAIGQARLDYIRGDSSNEGTGLGFRPRLSLLGDIVNSGPVFVGEPSMAWPDYAPFPTGSEAYSEFKNGAAKTRQKMVYVGANDGMLHAFKDDSAQEVLAYIPGMAYSQNTNEGLHYLTAPNYAHKFYVDLTPSISDIYISSGGATDWHTVLIGGMRSGGRGYYALDITDPDKFVENATNAKNTVLWEFTSDDDADLGYTYSRPFIGMTNAGTWVAIFGNGYNDTGNGSAQLFVVEIAKGIDGSWGPGDVVKIDTGAGDATNRNGLATPALADLDGNGTIDRVYAGDLFGNMWVFDLSATTPNTWKKTTPVKLFTTQANQPITAKPVLASHPTQPNSTSPSNLPNLMVYFGTGQYLVDGDKNSTTQQSFYGVWDKGGVSDITKLIQQTFDSSYSGRVLTRNAVDYSTDDGWFFNFPDTGERAVTSPIARADTVFFNTFIPQDDPCNAGGYGFKFAIDMTTGGSQLEPTIDSNDDGKIDDSDKQTSTSGGQSTLAAVRQDGYLPEPVFIEDLAFTAQKAVKIKALPNPPAGRFSWQQLIP